MKLKLFATLSFFVAFVFVGCSHKKSYKSHHGQSCAMKGHKKSAKKYLKHVGEPETIGQLKAPTFKHMSFAGQPTKEDLNAAKEAGYEVVINIRSPKEVSWDEEKHVKDLGMKYYNVPLLDKHGKIDAAAVLKLERIHKETHKQKQLIHCSSGNRAAAWMAAHLMVKHGLSADEALQVARPLGVTKKEVEQKVRDLAASL